MTALRHRAAGHCRSRSYSIRFLFEISSFFQDTDDQHLHILFAHDRPPRIHFWNIRCFGTMDIVKNGVHKELCFSVPLLIQQFYHLAVCWISRIEADSKPARVLFSRHTAHLFAEVTW